MTHKNINMSKAILKKTLFFSLILFLVSYTLLYTTYKRYDIAKFPQDAPVYMNIVVDESYQASYGYPFRVFTTTLVRFLKDRIPLYNTQINADITSEEKKVYWVFCVLNYLAVWLTACLLFFYFNYCYRIPDLFSFLGSIFYLLAYTTLQSNLIPYVDALAHLFIVLLLILLHLKCYYMFAVILFLNIFNKEIISVFFFMYCSLQFFVFRHIKMAILSGVSLFSFACFLLISTAGIYEDKYRILEYSDYFIRIYNINIDALQIFGGYFPLWISVALYCFFKLKKHPISIKPNSALLIFIGLYLVAIMAGSADPVRVIANGLPIYILFQIQVFERVYKTFILSS